MMKRVVPFLFCFMFLGCEFDVPLTDDIPDRVRLMQVRDVDYPEPVTEAEVMAYAYVQMLMRQHDAFCTLDDRIEYFISHYFCQDCDFDIKRYREVGEAIERSYRMRNMMFNVHQDMAVALID